MQVRLPMNVLAFYLKRQSVLIKMYLRLNVNAFAFSFKCKGVFFIPQFHSVPASAWSSRPARH